MKKKLLQLLIIFTFHLLHDLGQYCTLLWQPASAQVSTWVCQLLPLASYYLVNHFAATNANVENEFEDIGIAAAYMFKRMRSRFLFVTILIYFGVKTMHLYVSWM